MPEPIMLSPLGFHRIFHPTDFSPASKVAFAHALKLALVARTEFTVMHVAPKKTKQPLTDFPQVRATLSRWGISGGTPRGILVKKLRVIAKDAAKGILQHLSMQPTGLVVLATNQRDGLARWMQPSVAEPVARAGNTRTLFVPTQSKGFVSLEDGSVTVRTILIPVAQTPNPQAAIDAAALLATAFDLQKVSFQLLHVGTEQDKPAFQTPQREGWSWNTSVCEGDVVDRILAAGAECEADVIIMVTEGRKGFADMLKGTTTERVVRGARCPVITLPAH